MAYAAVGFDIVCIQIFLQNFLKGGLQNFFIFRQAFEFLSWVRQEIVCWTILMGNFRIMEHLSSAS